MQEAIAKTAEIPSIAVEKAEISGETALNKAELPPLVVEPGYPQ